MRPPAINILPADAVETLQKAAATDVTKANPLARIKAIDAAIAKVKAKHPKYFKD